MPLVKRLALPLSTLITWVSTIQPVFEEADLEEALAVDLETEAALDAEAELQAEEAEEYGSRRR
jgi:hypothetical protein